MPNAPSVIASSRSARIRSLARSHRPVCRPSRRPRSAARRCRRGTPMLTLVVPSNFVRYSAVVDQSNVRSGRPSRPPLSSTNETRSATSGNGAYELPSTPITSVVTPWRTFGSWRGSARIISPPWLCRSMNPGATTLPVASIVRSAAAVAAKASSAAVPARVMRRCPSAVTATVPGKPGAPVPSTIVPFAIRSVTASLMRWAW